MTTPNANAIALHRRIVAIAARVAPEVATAYESESDPTAAADAARDAIDDAAEARRGDLRRALADLSMTIVFDDVWAGAPYSATLARIDALDARIAD